MKNILKKGFSAIILSMLFVLAAPSVMPDNTGMEEVEAATIKLNATNVTLIKGQTKKLKIKGTSKKVKWRSNKKSVATVNSEGKITAVKKGTATITAKVGGKKYKCKVTVENPKINKTSATIVKGNTLKLKISGTSQAIKWSSSKKSVATVNSKGKVTAKKKGTATITAKIGSKKYNCKVTVVKAGTMSVANTSVSVNESSSKKVNVTLYGGDILTYNIADTSIVSCEWGSWSGNVIPLKITGLKPGTTTITITNDVNSDECKIKVTVNSKGYAALKTFMTKKGTKKASGDYSYSYEFEDTKLTVLYNPNTNYYTFTTDLNGQTCEITFSESSTKITPVVEYKGSYSMYEAYTTVYKNTYKLTNINYYFTFSKNTTGLPASTSFLQDSANVSAQLCFAVTEDFLNDKVGISLMDLGFTALW